jgi:hypothetical protein
MVFTSEKYRLVSVTSKFLLLLPILCIVIACNEQTKEIQQQQVKIDSLEKQLDKTYKPVLESS